MGGQDRRDPNLREHGVEVGVGSIAAAETGEGLSDGVVQEAVACSPFPAAQRTDACTGLGQVDQLEVERERGDDRLGVPQLERVQLRFEPLADLRLVAAPEVDGGKAQPLDEIVDRLAGLLRDDLAKQRTEQPDLERERVTGPRRADAAWFRGTRGSGPMASRGHAVAHVREAMNARRHNRAATRPQPSAGCPLPTLVW